ncbi:unnamed protein product [Nippostrongylus brasiliensis]|uniref:TIL domain-containing protein n=1 Tax=Nippostrongylus brasiliensis TaxID=27835 RepID=A0A158R265_NIPBR|nr:unnamed protein product [Nippostrongylus brasiliensis]
MAIKVLVIAVAHLVQNSNAQCCPPNELFKECGTACEPSCKNPNPTVCTDQCIVNVCQCKEGFYRNSNNSCVDSCAADSECGENAEYNECGSACAPSCSNPKTPRRPACLDVCVKGCQCKSGFLRDSDGKCVTKCPKKPL